MRRLVILPLLLFWCSPAAATDVPVLTGRVNDTADILSSSTVRDLETLLKAHEDSTSNQVVVLTVRSLDGESIEEYSIAVAEQWKLGQKGKDNGVLLLIAVEDRKVRIEVGRGLEGVLPDITCGSIIRKEITPRFREGDYDGGVTAGVHAILSAIGGTYTADAGGSGGMDFIGILIGGGIFLVVVGTFTVLGVISRGAMSWVLYVFLMPFWLAFPASFFGWTTGLTLFGVYAVGYLAAKLWFARSPAGKSFQEHWGRSFGGWSSGSGGWLSGGGGGFSGGGGSFSGGGASGSW